MKKILFTLCLAAALTGARGQIYIDSYRFGAAVSADLLLDSFPTAALAISFRKLDKDYAGNCITIQRDNGDTSNVAFSGNYLDTASVKSFCGEGAGDSCRVRVWFDQSGNARNFRQNTAANQPLIMINGVLTYDNGEISLRFDGTNDFMEIPNSTATFKFFHDGSESTLFMINRYGNSSNPNILYTALANSTGNSDNFGAAFIYDDRTASSKNNSTFYVTSANNVSSYLATLFSNDRITPNQINLSYIFSDGDNATLANRLSASINGGATFENNTANISVSSSNASYNLHLGRTGDGNFYLLGAMQEIVLYAADKSSDRTAIRDNINRFYSIY